MLAFLKQMAEERLRTAALAAWQAAGMPDGPVHVVSLKRLFARFYDVELREPQPNRAAADAVTAALQKGRRHWSQEDFVTWTVQLALPWTRGDGENAPASVSSPRHSPRGRPGNNPRGKERIQAAALRQAAASPPASAAAPPVPAVAPAPAETDRVDAPKGPSPFGSPTLTSPNATGGGPDECSPSSGAETARSQLSDHSLLSERSGASLASSASLRSKASCGGGGGGDTSARGGSEARLFDRMSRPSPRGVARAAKPSTREQPADASARPAWDDRTNPQGDANGRDVRGARAARDATPREEREAARLAEEVRVEAAARAAEASKVARIEHLRAEAAIRAVDTATWAAQAASDIRLEVAMAAVACRERAQSAARRATDAAAAEVEDNAAFAASEARAEAEAAHASRLHACETAARVQVEAAEGSVYALEMRFAREANERAAERLAALDEAERMARELRRRCEVQAAHRHGMELSSLDVGEGDDAEAMSDGGGIAAMEQSPLTTWRRLRRTVRTAAHNAMDVVVPEPEAPAGGAEHLGELERSRTQAQVKLANERKRTAAASWDSGARFDISGRATPPPADARFEISGRATPPREQRFDVSGRASPPLRATPPGAEGQSPVWVSDVEC